MNRKFEESILEHFLKSRLLLFVIFSFMISSYIAFYDIRDFEISNFFNAFLFVFDNKMYIYLVILPLNILFVNYLLSEYYSNYMILYKLKNKNAVFNSIFKKTVVITCMADFILIIIIIILCNIYSYSIFSSFSNIISLIYTLVKALSVIFPFLVINLLYLLIYVSLGKKQAILLVGVYVVLGLIDLNGFLIHMKVINPLSFYFDINQLMQIQITFFIKMIIFIILIFILYFIGKKITRYNKLFEY